MEILDRLFELRDESYAEFQSKLTPNVPRERFIGVRVPETRKLAEAYGGEKEHVAFLRTLPHDYFDENMLHGLLVSRIRDYEFCIREVDRFLPYVDNWAVCDSMSPRVFKRHREELLEKIHEWCGSDKTYTIRFGIGMLMRHFLDEDFRPEYLEIPAAVTSDEYYVKMMIAWYYATALAKQWEDTIPYIEENRLGEWIHNRSIQKAVESRRISPQQKEYLKCLRRKGVHEDETV